MGAIHDHGCWVALAPITGIETHRHFRVRLDAQQVARLELATEAGGRGRPRGHHAPA